MKVLVVRPDRLGDVILSTPAFQAIAEWDQNPTVEVCVQGSVIPILDGLPFIHGFLEYQPQGRHRGWVGFFRFCSDLRSRHYQVAVVLQSHWKIALALFLARIPTRVGPLSKLHSYLLYNRGVRQRRSKVEMHEAEYNLQLVERLHPLRLRSTPIQRKPTQVALKESMKDQAKKWLLNQGWKPDEKLILVHPGMGGSALNWPVSHYHQLVQTLLAEGKQVLLTGGITEKALLHSFLEPEGVVPGPQAKKVPMIYCAESAQSTLDFLAGLFSFADLVIAPSTGPLHLAVALGKSVLTFYPPIRVQSEKRWGPYLPRFAHVFTPQVECGEDFRCRGKACRFFPCMESLTVSSVLDKVK